MLDTSPIDLLPPPRVIHSRMGKLYRELGLLRRLLRLSQQAKVQRGGPRIADSAKRRRSHGA
jgi:hypothetical protein